MLKKVLGVSLVWTLAACGMDGSGELDDVETEEMAAIVADPSVFAKVKDGDVVPLHARCGRPGPNLENRRVPNASRPGVARQRSGSSTSCEPLGQLDETDDPLYFCYTLGNDGFTWTYLRNSRGPQIQGWVRDDLLRLNPDGRTRGSLIPCPF
jgi:hypothetical protein